ncbi:MAG: Shedu anti-phage system protein SduA domain-containing protein [Patescibacteria group bacterium]
MENEIKKISDSPVYFLGLCERFNEPTIGNVGEHKIKRTDLIGLRFIFLSSIFPFSSESFYLTFLLDNHFVSDGGSLTLKVRHRDSGEEVGSISITAHVLGAGNRLASRFTLGAAKIPGNYPLPGSYEVFLKSSDSEVVVGGFDLIHIPALPLTPERVKALKSDPTAAKYIRFELTCNDCHDSIKAWVGINGKEDNKNEDGYIWYEDLPEDFVCSCGRIKRSLKYLRENLHGILGHKPSPFSSEEEIERNYTSAALKTTLRDFEEVIEHSKTEEEIQKFIELHPIVLACFSPEFLKFKAPATAKFKTDFALLNQKGELVLIEIEKANTPLFTKMGTQHSKLTQAIGQVEDWLKEARRNKLGVIDDLGINGVSIDMVTAVKGVVIAGRSLKKYDTHIEKLHARQDISFFTFDDLLKSLRNIVLRVEEI